MSEDEEDRAALLPAGAISEVNTEALPNAERLLLGELDRVCDAPPSGYPCKVCGQASIMHGFKRLLARVRPSWQPIESAPRNERVLVLTTFPKAAGIQTPTVVAADYLSGHSGWLTVPGRYSVKPTHWMPLPIRRWSGTSTRIHQRSWSLTDER